MRWFDPFPDWLGVGNEFWCDDVAVLPLRRSCSSNDGERQVSQLKCCRIWGLRELLEDGNADRFKNVLELVSDSGQVMFSSVVWFMVAPLESTWPVICCCCDIPGWSEIEFVFGNLAQCCGDRV